MYNLVVNDAELQKSMGSRNLTESFQGKPDLRQLEQSILTATGFKVSACLDESNQTILVRRILIG